MITAAKYPMITAVNIDRSTSIGGVLSTHHVRGSRGGGGGGRGSRR